MEIVNASLTLRFYKRDGWTKNKVRKLLVNPKMKVTLRDSTHPWGQGDYFAVYEDSGHHVFKKSEIEKHTIEDRQKFGNVDWYINKEK